MFRWLAKLVCIPTQRPSTQHAGVSEAPNTAPTSAGTQMGHESYSPRIPPELVHFILSDIWDAPQTPQERSAFVKNTALVNRTWLTLVAYVTSRDVHICTGEDGMTFIRRLSGYPGRVADLFTMMKMQVTNAICRSVTFHVHDTVSYTPWGTILPGSVLYPTGSRPAVRMRAAIAVFLHALAMRGSPHWAARLPRLRHIALRYTDWVGAYDDALRHLEQGPFPPQVTRLSIHHAFPNLSCRDTVCERWLSTRQGADARYAPPPCLCRGAWCECGLDVGRGMDYQDAGNVRHLALSGPGATAPFAVAALRACRGVETLELEFGEPGGVRLEALAPLPPAVKTVVLRRPLATGSAGAVDRGAGEQIWWWRLCQALEAGTLFNLKVQPRRATVSGGVGTTSSKDYDCDSSADRGRIVVCFGPAPDPMVFEAVRGECRGFGVELVHEPDDLCEPVVPG